MPFIAERYNSYRSGIGKDIMDGVATFRSLEDYILDKDVSVASSGRQEWLRSRLNQSIWEV